MPMRLHDADSSPDVDDTTGPLTNGHSMPTTNGTAAGGKLVPVPSLPATSVARVFPPGTRLYEDSIVDREQFVRLVVQSLRDIGYVSSASMLEAESGYTYESQDVAEFRTAVLEGQWDRAEELLEVLGVHTEEDVRATKFLISQQKYLEMLESHQINAALMILRNELAPLGIDLDRLHLLSSLMMSSSSEDLFTRAQWDGAAGSSRRQLLSNLQKFVSTSTMIPPRRFDDLLMQSRKHQISSCLYHNVPDNEFSLFADHSCSRSGFPTLTTHILAEHEDEVWQMQWSHDGQYLASASRDCTAIIWRIGPSQKDPATRDWTRETVLKGHKNPVGFLSWSPDDSKLLTSAEATVRIWNVKTGVNIREIDDAHADTVTGLEWYPDGSAFITSGLDGKIIAWNLDGRQIDNWGVTPVRVLDLALTPDGTKLVATGHLRSMPSGPSTDPAVRMKYRLIVYDRATKEERASIMLPGELTSLKISPDSRYALLNHAPDEVHLWDLETFRLVRKFTGQQQGRNVIRSCFGGVNANFIVSGSEDSNVYVWHRDTGALLEVLRGHGAGSVNSVAWNPRDRQMFASCSDDGTVRIWEPSHMEEEDEEDSILSIRGGAASWNGSGSEVER